MEEKEWLFEVYKMIGAFFFVIVGYTILQLIGRWAVNKVFGKNNPTSNPGSNGDLIKVLKANGKSLANIEKVICATDIDGKNVIMKIWNKVKKIKNHG